MKRIFTIFLALVLISSASALVEMHGGVHTEFGAREQRACYVDLNLRLVCPDVPIQPVTEFEGDSEEECYFDSRGNAICPDYPVKEDDFQTRRIDSLREFETKRYQPPHQISASAPVFINGTFAPRWKQRVYRSHWTY